MDHVADQIKAVMFKRRRLTVVEVCDGHGNMVPKGTDSLSPGRAGVTPTQAAAECLDPSPSRSQGSRESRSSSSPGINPEPPGRRSAASQA